MARFHDKALSPRNDPQRNSAHPLTLPIEQCAEEKQIWKIFELA